MIELKSSNNVDISNVLDLDPLNFGFIIPYSRAGSGSVSILNGSATLSGGKGVTLTSLSLRLLKWFKERRGVFCMLLPDLHTSLGQTEGVQKYVE